MIICVCLCVQRIAMSESDIGSAERGRAQPDDLVLRTSLYETSV